MRDYWGERLLWNPISFACLVSWMYSEDRICDFSRTAPGERFRNYIPAYTLELLSTKSSATPPIEGIVIATPAENRYFIASKALPMGKTYSVKNL